MEKFKNMYSSLKTWLFGTNFALLAFASYTSKMVLTGASLEDALVFLSISGLYGYTMFLKSKAPDPVRLNAEVQTQLNDMAKRLNDGQMKANLEKRPMRW